MTREEAIKELKQFSGTTRLRLSANFWVALNMAIKALEQENCEDWYDTPSDEMTLEQARKAVKDLRKKIREYLEQEPCEDCVSRQAVLSLFNKSAYYSWEMCLLKRNIEELPPVTPTHKKGEWVKTGQSFINPNKFLCYSCSECGGGSGKVKTKFCPNCGAEMESEE